MATTPNLGLTLVEQAQAQKEVTVNQALMRIDALINNGAISRTVSTPPGSPVAGDLYIVGASPSGAWAGKALQIAYFDQIWRFVVPRTGMTLWVASEDLLYSFDGSSWIPSGANILGAASLTPLLTTDLIPIIRGGIIYLATIEDCLGATPPFVPGSLIFNTAGSSGLAAGVV